MPQFRSPSAPRPSRRALPRPLALRSALAALLVLTAVGLAACGGSSSNSAATTATTPTTTGAAAAGGAAGAGRAAFAKYTTCLKQHGVTLPTRRPGGFGGGGGNGGPPTGATATGRPVRRDVAGGFFSGANSAKFRAAQTACSKLLPAGFGRGGFFGGGGGGGGNTAAFAAYRNCLMLHGVKIGAGFGAWSRRPPGRPGCAGRAQADRQGHEVRSRRAQACDPVSGAALRVRRRPRRQPRRREARIDHAPHRELLRAARRAHRGGRVVRVLDDLRHVVVRIERGRAHGDGVARRRAVERVGLGQHLVRRVGLADVRDERHAHVAACECRTSPSRRTRCSHGSARPTQRRRSRPRTPRCRRTWRRWRRRRQAVRPPRSRRTSRASARPSCS